MLTPEGYKSRLVEKQFDEYMQTFGAVCIEGPKYCGKTWTARSRAPGANFKGINSTIPSGTVCQMVKITTFKTGSLPCCPLRWSFPEMFRD